MAIDSAPSGIGRHKRASHRTELAEREKWLHLTFLYRSPRPVLFASLESKANSPRGGAYLSDLRSSRRLTGSTE
jgi:hypothetical protein